jgi:hypothetical protein
MSQHLFGPRRPNCHDDATNPYGAYRDPAVQQSEDWLENLAGCVGPLGCLAFLIVGGILGIIHFGLANLLGFPDRVADFLSYLMLIALVCLALFGATALLGWLP